MFSQVSLLLLRCLVFLNVSGLLAFFDRQFVLPIQNCTLTWVDFAVDISLGPDLILYCIKVLDIFVQKGVIKETWFEM